MRLLFFISFLGVTRSSRCIYQPRTRRVMPGGSVTIPCSYSGSDELGEARRVIWTEHNGEYCSSDNTIFSPSGKATERYKGRLSREKDATMTWMEYITITELKPTDGPRFCCVIHNSHDNKHGTLLQLPDTEYVTQLDELMAVSGEEVTIPCYFSKDTSDLSVSWNYVDRSSYLCTKEANSNILESNNKHHYGQYSLVNFPQDFSLRIRDIHRNYGRNYCCIVYSRVTLESRQFTRLVVADYQPSWDHPAKEMSVQEGQSVNLTCSYSLSGRYTERDIMRVNVYWRVGNVTGSYAYHPYQEMVHPAYIHRTSITGRTHLMIKDVTRADNTSFHCFVVVKLCAGYNDYKDHIHYGGGTRLIINDEPNDTEQSDHEDPSPEKGGNLSSRDLILIIASSSVAVLLIIILLIILKVKGCICKKKNSSSEQGMNIVQAEGDVTSEEAPYCEILTKKPEDASLSATDAANMKEAEGGHVEDGEDGNIFYAKLNKTKLKEKRPPDHPKQNEEVVYAAVVKTSTE